MKVKCGLRDNCVEISPANGKVLIIVLYYKTIMYPFNGDCRSSMGELLHAKVLHSVFTYPFQDSDTGLANLY